ncbi:MAG: mannosyltransferase, partial [Bacteroidota bacterium]
YPPRECGIATYSQDLINALRIQFDESFKMTICALETDCEKHKYVDNVQYILDTTDAVSYDALTRAVNDNTAIKMVLLQHEFGFFALYETALLHLLQTISVPVVVTFHTVLPAPDAT